ncbi:MAG TPA: tripartite tricarboxylate transporter substrate-binding protein [Gemmatimonadaceae bacterium]
MSERMTRRRLLERSAALVGGFVLTDLPARACIDGARVRWIVGWSPGGGFDTYSRLAEPFIEAALGAQIVIDNVPGAGGRVGALMLSRSRPDGRTLGILNGSGFLWDRAPGLNPTADLARDFTVLARVCRRQQVIIAGARAGVESIYDLIALARRRPLVAGITAIDSSNFASLAAVTDLLGWRTEFVAGYPGTTEVILGLQRGDCDITSLDIETFIEAPALQTARPVLQITPERSPDQRIAAVPHLTGPTGLITVEPELFAGEPSRAHALAAAITAYLEFGRLFAGPAGMAQELRDCVESGIHRALRDPGFAAAARRAGRSIDVMPGAEVRRQLPAAMAAVLPIAPVAAAAARSIR